MRGTLDRAEDRKTQEDRRTEEDRRTGKESTGQVKAGFCRTGTEDALTEQQQKQCAKYLMPLRQSPY